MSYNTYLRIRVSTRRCSTVQCAVCVSANVRYIMILSQNEYFSITCDLVDDVF